MMRRRRGCRGSCSGRGFGSDGEEGVVSALGLYGREGSGEARSSRAWAVLRLLGLGRRGVLRSVFPSV